KGTDHMQADIKRRIAKLRDSHSHTRHGKGSRLDHIDREGAGQVVLLGPPNCGKSSLLSVLTNAHPEIADYPYSTTLPMPGMMAFEDAPIQLIDLPPFTEEYSEPWMYSLIRQSDLCLLILDGSHATEELVKTVEEIVLLLEERHIKLVMKRANLEEEERIMEVPCRIILTKEDLGDHCASRDELSSLFPVLSISVAQETGLDALRKEVFTALDVIRIYTKLPGKPPDMDEPYVLPVGSTALDGVTAVHRDFVDRLRYIRVWGSGRFEGQQVTATHPLADKDIIEIHLS
ncbi:MAG: GTPase, partial [Candidatus Bipolaricaulota bacterium]|nr:GTPase [Candidatus Bipolaricaulota bacterium]